MSARTIQEWWSPAALAELRLTDLPATARNINDLADSQKWRRPDLEFPANSNGVWRFREGRGGGFEYRIDVLPSRAQADLALKLNRALPGPDARALAERDERWSWFEKLPDRKKAQARVKLDALMSVRDLVTAGQEHDIAMRFVATRSDVCLRTLYNWQSTVTGKPVADWLAYLAPRHAGRASASECTDEAWEWYKGYYLRQEQPSHAHSYRRLQQAAAEHGWTIPSAKTLERRIDALNQATVTYFREGPDALKRLFPAQERDRSVFHALEAVNADGHTWDVFVRWPDGAIGRPSMVAFQDLFSGTILSWRVDRSPNKDAVRLAFADVVEEYGIPSHCWLDNGRDFASKWITGGVPNRYRFKVKDEDPVGIMPSLGVEIHWTTPYHGQAKPIERAFRDFVDNIAREPQFAGAWTGNSVSTKPENYGSKAVPLDVFLAVVADGIREHNTRVGRRSKVCGGKLSFLQAFAASYEVSPITQASEWQRRRLLLASELVSARKPDGAIHIAGNRYWAEFLTDEIGRKVVARLDPQNLHGGVHVERADGAYLGFAACQDAVGFNDTAEARQLAAAKNATLKAWRVIASAERQMNPEQVAAMMPIVEAPELPNTKLVRPFFGANGNAALKVDREFEDDEPAVPKVLQFAIGMMARPGQKNGADD